MEARRKTVEALNKHYRAAGRVRVAGQEPPQPPPNDGGGFGHEASGHMKRAIPEGYSYDPRALKPLAKMLWAMSVSLGHAMTAHRQFTKLKSGTISPDGLIGGRGYVMAVKDLRKELYSAIEGISAISDTIHDEINAPHWKPKLAQLERDDLEDIGRLVGDAERILDDPEGEAEEDLEDAEEGNGKTKGKSWEHPAIQKDEKKKGGDPKSEVPTGGDKETLPDSKRPQDTGPNQGFKQSSTYSYGRVANSSLPVDTMPGGPRVDHLDRAEPRGEANTYNDSEPSLPQGDQGLETVLEPPRAYDYTGDYENDFSHSAASGIPDAVTDSTPTEGFDFGIGRGNGNDAHGQGQNHEVNSPSGKGVFGPAAELPGDLGAKMHDDTPGEGSLALTEQAQLDKGPHRQARGLVNQVMLDEIAHFPKQARSVVERFKQRTASTKLPNDDQPPSASGKGGRPGEVESITWAASGVPGDGVPAKQTPLTGTPIHENDLALAQTKLPGDDLSVDYTFDKSPGPRDGYRYERTNQPYIKWDSTTHQMRPDPVHQRDVEGPYVKEAVQ